MGIGDRIKKVRKKLGLTQNELAMKANISRSYLADVENNRYNPSFSTLEKIAEALNVSIDRLTGEAASSIIEDRLKEINMTLEELAEKSKVPLTFLQNLDEIIPDNEIDGGEECYRYMSAIAWVLGLPGSKLRVALARQELPFYDNFRDPRSLEEIFANKNFDDINTLAAHHEGEDWTEEELAELERFKEFLRLKRQQK